MSKQRYATATPEAVGESNPWPDNTGLPAQRIRISGLRETSEPGVFELDGVRPRNVDWQAVAEALKIDPAKGDDELMEAIGEAVWAVDIR